MLEKLKIENLSMFFYLALGWIVLFFLEDFNKLNLLIAVLMLCLHFYEFADKKISEKTK